MKLPLQNPVAVYDDIEEIDVDTANLAVRYLLKAYDRNHPHAVDDVEAHAVEYDEATNRRQLIRMYGD